MPGGGGTMASNRSNAIRFVEAWRLPTRQKPSSFSIPDETYKLAAALDTSRFRSRSTFPRSPISAPRTRTNEFVYTVGKFDGTLIRRNEKSEC